MERNSTIAFSTLLLISMTAAFTFEGTGTGLQQAIRLEITQNGATHLNLSFNNPNSTSWFQQFNFTPNTTLWDYNCSINIGGEYYTFPDTKSIYHGCGDSAGVSGSNTSINMTVINQTINSSIQGLGISGYTASGYNGSALEVSGYINSPFLRVGEMANLLLRSETIGTTWTRINITTAVGANNNIDPTGQLTAEYANGGTSADACVYQQVADGTQFAYTFSTYLKANNAATANVTLKLNNSAGNSNTATFTITNRWARYWVTTNLTSVHTLKEARIINGLNNVTIWGTQLNAGETPLVYSYPTTTATISATRYIYTSLNAYLNQGLEVGGTTSFYGIARSVKTTGGNLTVSGLNMTTATAASGTVPIATSNAVTFSAGLWDGIGAKNSQMALLLAGINGTMPIPELQVRNMVKNSVGNNSTLFTLNADGNASVVGSMSIGKNLAIGNASTTPLFTAYIRSDNNTGANLVVEDGRNTTSRPQLRLVTNNANNSGDYFLFSFRGDNADVVMSIYNASSASFSQFLQYKYLPDTNALYFGNPAIMNMNYTSGNMSIGEVQRTSEYKLRVNGTMLIGDTSNVSEPNAIEIESDGTIHMLNNATTYNIIQADISTWAHINGWEFDSDIQMWKMPLYAVAYHNFVIPHDMKNGTSPMIRLHYVANNAGCAESFTLQARKWEKCGTVHEYESGGREICNEITSGVTHCIHYTTLDQEYGLDDLLQYKVTRTDECEREVYVAAIDMVYEQDTIGSRTEWVK